MLYTALVEKLISALRKLPGVGPKSAQRMAFHLLENGKADGLALSKILNEALTSVGRCKKCRTFSEMEYCQICNNPKRNNSILCVVETPADIVAIEQTNNYSGFYFVLMGHLSPIDGIGPNEIGINELKQLLESSSNLSQQSTVLQGTLQIDPSSLEFPLGASKENNQVESQKTNGIPIKEVIIATNPTIEGEATAHYISNLVRQYHIKCTRIAYGIPIGGELEYLDSNTLTRALMGRIEL